ncbi:hypothetical protein Tco_1085771 [Tanacetum coccineum]
METPEKPFIALVNIKVIESFMQKVGYQGVVDKVSTFYTKFLAQPWQTMFKDYHSIKDDIPLVSVYSIGNVLFRGMLISNAFLTDEIYATDDYAEYETVFVKVVVPTIQPQPVVSTQGTHRTTPSAYRSPTLTVASPQGKKRKQIARETSSPRKPTKVTIKQKAKTTSIPPATAKAQENVSKVPEQLEEKRNKMVKGDKDEESYASEFADSMFNDDNDDTCTRIEPGSHKENPKVVDDDDVIVIEKKDDKNVDDEDKDVDVEKKDDGAEDKDNDDQTDQALELTVFVSPTTATTSKVKSKRGFPSNKTKILPRIIAGMSKRRGQIRNHIENKFVTHEFFMGKIREFLVHCNDVVLELRFTKINEMIKDEMPRLVHLVVKKDREMILKNVLELILKEFSTHAPKIIEELFQKHMQNTTLNLYPTTSSSTAAISTVDLQHQLYLTMKSKPQDQAADPKLWEILKMKMLILLKGEKKGKKINLTASTLIFPGIEAHDPYSIIDKPDTGLIYLNNKNEKQVMYLVEIVKFCDATLEKVLKEVKLRIFQNEFWKKPPMLGELDLDIMKAYKREITKRLRHRE